MTIAWEKVLPVVLSIVVIIVIAIVREYSKTLAAITATMPLTIPLALWIVYAAEGGERAAVTQFADAALLSIGATVLFLVAVWLTVRAGWTLLPILVAGYAAWGGGLLVGFLLRGVLG